LPYLHGFSVDRRMPKAIELDWSIWQLENEIYAWRTPLLVRVLDSFPDRRVAIIIDIDRLKIVAGL
jgi:hypothetical protein